MEQQAQKHPHPTLFVHVPWLCPQPGPWCSTSQAETCSLSRSCHVSVSCARRVVARHGGQVRAQRTDERGAATESAPVRHLGVWGLRSALLSHSILPCLTPLPTPSSFISALPFRLPSRSENTTTRAPTHSHALRTHAPSTRTRARARLSGTKVARSGPSEVRWVRRRCDAARLTRRRCTQSPSSRWCLRAWRGASPSPAGPHARAARAQT